MSNEHNEKQGDIVFTPLTQNEEWIFEQVMANSSRIDRSNTIAWTAVVMSAVGIILSFFSTAL